MAVACETARVPRYRVVAWAEAAAVAWAGAAGESARVEEVAMLEGSQVLDSPAGVARKCHAAVCGRSLDEWSRMACLSPAKPDPVECSACPSPAGRPTPQRQPPPPSKSALGCVSAGPTASRRRCRPGSRTGKARVRCRRARGGCAMHGRAGRGAAQRRTAQRGRQTNKHIPSGSTRRLPLPVLR